MVSCGWGVVWVCECVRRAGLGEDCALAAGARTALGPRNNAAGKQASKHARGSHSNVPAPGGSPGAAGRYSGFLATYLLF